MITWRPMREFSRIYLRGRNCPRTKPQTRLGVKAGDMINVQVMFNEGRIASQEKMANILSSPVSDVSQAVSTGGGEISPEVADNGDVLHIIAPV